MKTLLFLMLSTITLAQTDTCANNLRLVTTTLTYTQKQLDLAEVRMVEKNKQLAIKGDIIQKMELTLAGYDKRIKKQRRVKWIAITTAILTSLFAGYTLAR